MTGRPEPLDVRSLGWLRYLHRKATTPDDWSRTGPPPPHWDDRTGEPMLSWQSAGRWKTIFAPWLTPKIRYIA